MCAGEWNAGASRPYPVPMKTLPLLAILPLLLSACPSGSGGLGDDDDSTPDVPTFDALPEAVAEAFATEADGFDAPGAAIAIRHGDVLYVGTYGSKDPAGGDPIEATTLFRIGSITKMMTATALLQQVAAGELALGDAVADHIPGLALQGVGPSDEITLHHLLSHTSGLSEITPIAGGEDDARLGDFTDELAGQIYLMNDAGEFWNYSNPNFSLAGAVLENTADRYYRDVMQTEVFAPLGMDRTMFLGSEVLADGDYAVAWGRGWTEAEPGPLRIEPDAYDDAWSRPAGFAWSSVLDLVTFGDFLVDGAPGVLSDAMQAELVSPQTPTAAFLDALDYGYGTMLWHGLATSSSWYDLETLEHGGAIPGFAAELWTVPSEDLVVATLASTDGAYFGQTRASIFAALLGVAPTTFPDLEIAADLTPYTGTYNDPYNVGDLIVTLDDSGGLVIDAPLLDTAGVAYETTLTPTSRDHFQWVLYGNFPLDITILPGSDGSPHRWFRNRYFVAERTEGVADGRSVPDPAALRALFSPKLLR